MAAPPSEHPGVDVLGPMDLGTTWVYRTTTNGKPTGLEVDQITGTTLGPTGESGVVEEHSFDNLLGNGPLHVVQYLLPRGGRVLETGLRVGATYADDQPPTPLIETPLRPGKTWRYDGSIASQQTTLTTTVEGIGTVRALGGDRPGCPHLRTTHRATDSSGTVSVETDDSWLCPGLGAVKTVIRQHSSGKVYVETLAELHGPSVDVGRGALAPPRGREGAGEPGAVPAIDQARTDAISGASLDTRRYAWTMTRKGSILYPPVGGPGQSVLAEDDGTVSSVDPGTGEVRWQLQLKGPIVAPPVLAGPVVLVADATKSLFALDVDTGFARWVDRFPDLVSAAPAVTGDEVIAPTEDARLRALRLRDGKALHTVSTGFLVTAPPALSGDTLVVAGQQSGGITAFSVPDLTTKWSTSLAANLAPTEMLSAGPVIAGGVAVVAYPGGQLFAFDLRDGDLRWRAASPEDVDIAPAISRGTLVEVSGHFVLARSLADGSERWRGRIDSPLDTSPVIVGDRVVVLDATAHLHLFSLATGSPGQVVTLPSPDHSTTLDSDVPMSFVDGSLVVPTHNSGPWPFTILFAFPTGSEGQGPKPEGVRLEGEVRPVPSAPITAPALQDGHLLVAGAFPAGVYDVPPAGAPRTLVESTGFVVSAVPAGDLVLVQDDTTLEAVPRSGGAARWRFTMGQPSQVAEPAVVGQTVVVPVLGKGLVGLDLQTGAVRWSSQFPGSGQSSPLPLPGGNVAYAVGGLTVLDAATGKVRWHQPGIDTFGRIAYDHGTILVEAVSAQAFALAAVDAASGRLLWLQPFNPQVGVGPAAGGGVAAAVDDSNVLSAFGEADGSKLWSVQLRTSPNGDPVVVGDRVIVQEQGRTENINQRDYRISVFDAHTGALEAQWELPGSGLTHAGFGAAGDVLMAPGITTQSAIFLLRMVNA